MCPPWFRRGRADTLGRPLPLPSQYATEPARRCRASAETLQARLRLGIVGHPFQARLIGRPRLVDSVLGFEDLGEAEMNRGVARLQRGGVLV